MHHQRHPVNSLWCVQALKSIDAAHRVLLTGTPLQNSMAELFMLMHFLDASKFDDPEAFEAEFATLAQNDQVCISAPSCSSAQPVYHVCSSPATSATQEGKWSSSHVTLQSPVGAHSSCLLLIAEQGVGRWRGCTSCWRPTCCGG